MPFHQPINLLRHKRATFDRGMAFSAILFIAALCVTILIWWPGLDGPFLFDDFPNLQNLREIGNELSFQSVGRYLAAWHGNPGRPLSAITFLIEDQAWPTAPERFKLNNLLLHLLVGIGVFALSRLLIRRIPHARGNADVLAVAVMMIWLIHPLQTSPIMLIVQRMTILVNGFIVLGLLAYIKTLASTRLAPNLRATLGVGFLFIFGFAAFMAKENGPLVFVYALVLNLTFLRPEICAMPDVARRIIWAGTAGMAILLAISLGWHVRDPSDAYATRDFTLLQRLLTEARILWDYAFRIFIPDMNATIFHDDIRTSVNLITPWSTLPAVVGIAFAAGLAWLARKMYPVLAFAIFWFLSGHFIESTVIPLELYFEHRNYLALLGPALACIAAANLLSRRFQYLVIPGLIAWAMLAAFSAHISARTWGDDLALASVWARENPESARARQHLAVTLMKYSSNSEAKAVLVESMDDFPKNSAFQFQLALLKCMVGTATADTFEKLMVRAKNAEPRFIIPDIVRRLGAGPAGTACPQSLSIEGRRGLIDTLLANPHYADRPELAGDLYYQKATLHIRRQQYESAINSFRAALRIDPAPQTALNIARLEVHGGNLQAAEDMLETARRLPYPFFKNLMHPLEPRIRDVEQLIADHADD